MFYQRFKLRVLRKKYINVAYVEESELKRCLDTVDLTALGVGSTLGAGLYVIAGQVARDVAGPSIILSFFVAAVASILAGLCYAEFGARVPRSGSAYVYSYVTVGELWAFVIGWNMILEYVIGTASVARGWSGYLDAMIGNRIENFSMTYVPMHIPGLAAYPDFVALTTILLVTGILMIGVRESSIFNKIFTTINLSVVAFVVGVSLFKSNFQYWNIPRENITDPEIHGNGGFFPYGISGTMAGAATCFYAFVGFDVIATTGEEVKNPQQAIPISILVSLALVFVAYVGVSAALTLMCPYFLLDSSAPLPHVFDIFGHNWQWAMYIVGIGAVCGLSTSLLGSMFPLPRVIYAMASDGLLFRSLSNVSDSFKTPLIATVVSGILAGIMAVLFDIKQLVDMMSIGTLLAYTLVSACVLILRYEPNVYNPSNISSNLVPSDNNTSYSVYDVISQAFSPHAAIATELSSTIVTYTTAALGGLMFIFCSVIIYANNELSKGLWWTVCLCLLCGILILTSLYIIVKQPQNTRGLTFQTPCVPMVPIISMFINIFLMLKLSLPTWLRFLVWMALGFSIYFCYGIWHSTEETQMKDNFAKEVIDTTMDNDVEKVNPNTGDREKDEDSPLLNRTISVHDDDDSDF
ncbi:high affinity cationic amino acid transporter 1-like [Glandiceps talaboti]